MLGVEKNHTSPTIAYDVLLSFLENLDSLRVRTEYYLEGLLDRGVDVLLYVGSYDWSVNWIGVERMVKTLEWNDSDEFSKQEWRDWHVKGDGSASNSPAGKIKNAGRLTFLTIEGAGHMVRLYLH